MSIRVRGRLALLRGWAAAELLDAVAAPRQWSPSGRGYVVEARYVPDVTACAETRRVIVTITEETAA